jgi:hypothetical protein
MLWLASIVGRPKVILFAVGVLVVGLTSYTMIQYGESKEKTRVVIEQQQKYIDTRKRIDNATSRPSDVDTARSRLLQRKANQ